MEDFEVDEENNVIGSGSFGQVLKYRHNDLNVVAVKKFVISGSARTSDYRHAK